MSECPDILHWALAGVPDPPCEHGAISAQPASAEQAAEELADLGSPVGVFVRERCVVNHFLCVECEVLFVAWKQWCGEQHRDHHGTIQTFGRDLRAAVPTLATIQGRDSKTGNRHRYYQGVGLQR